MGIVLAALTLSAIRRLTFVDLPRAGEIRMDAMVVGFGVALALITGLAFGLVPALSSSRPDLASVLRGSDEGTLTSKLIPRFGSRGVLVVGQVSLSVILLIGATLLIESLARLYRVDPGFSRPAAHHEGPIVANRFDTDQKRATLYEQLVQRVETLPASAARLLTATIPMADGWMGTTLELTGRAPTKLNERPIAIFQNITPDYFRTMEVKLKRGREFTSADNAGAVPVLIINENWLEHFGQSTPTVRTRSVSTS